MINSHTWLAYPFKPIKINNDVFSGLNKSEYMLENKFDGFRLTMIVGQDRIFTFTRQKNVLELPKNLYEEASRLRMPVGTILDGEIWSPLKRGGWGTLPEGMCKISFWDVIRNGMKNVCNQAIEVRREILKTLIPERPLGNISQASVFDATPDVVQRLEKQARDARLELSLHSGFIHGVVLKKNGSVRHDHPCRSVEHPDWLKIVFWH
jgi:ATP-dependent DNA ligase